MLPISEVFFQNYIICFLDTLIQKMCFLITKINIFRGELTDISAKKEALLPMPLVYLLLHMTTHGQ